MIIGCPKEIKAFENRVALIPSSVKALVDDGHKVLIEDGAGVGTFISNDAYLKAGAQIAPRSRVWGECDIITKVKEPLKEEWGFFRRDLIMYTFLHLAAEPELCAEMLKKEVCGIAYETIEEHGRLPLLAPMSEVAGRMSVQVGAWCLENQNGGKGILLGGVPGVRRGRVMILGGGVVGKNAARVASGMGAQVTMLDSNRHVLEEIDFLFQGHVQTLQSNEHTIWSQILRADLVIGAVLLPGARAPRLVTKEMVSRMEKGSVIVDVAIDQGGCIETIKRTTHDKPTYLVDGIVHYGVANMPGAASATSTFALSQETLPYLRKLAQLGLQEAIKKHAGLRLGLNTFRGKITHQSVAGALGLEYCPPELAVS